MNVWHLTIPYYDLPNGFTELQIRPYNEILIYCYVQFVINIYYLLISYMSRDA